MKFRDILILIIVSGLLALTIAITPKIIEYTQRPEPCYRSVHVLGVNAFQGYACSHPLHKGDFYINNPSPGYTLVVCKCPE